MTRLKPVRKTAANRDRVESRAFCHSGLLFCDQIGTHYVLQYKEFQNLKFEVQIFKTIPYSPKSEVRRLIVLSGAY